MGLSQQKDGGGNEVAAGDNQQIPWPDLFLIGTFGTALVLLLGRLLQNLRRRTPQPGKITTREPGAPPSQEIADGSNISPIPAQLRGSSRLAGSPRSSSGSTPGDTDPGHGTAPVLPPGSTSSATRWPVATKYIVGVILFLVAVIIIYISRSVIPVIILAALLALIVHPVIHFFESRLKTSRGLAIGITYLLVIAIILMIPLIFIPGVIEGINSLLSVDFQALIDNITQSLDEISAQVGAIPVLNTFISPSLDSISNAVKDITSVETPEPVPLDQAIGGTVDRLSQMLGAVSNILGPLVSAITSMVFILLISFYLSFSVPSMRVSYPKLLPPAYEPEITTLIGKITSLWTSFLRGQLALMFIVGFMVWLGNTILGNTAPLLLGIISGLLELIPNLGPALALIPGVGLALLLGSSHFAIPDWTFALIVLVFYLLVQVVENQFIVPYVLGGAVDLPPLAVIIGVLVGGTVFGILGALLAVPVIATGRDIFLYLYNKILEPPPEPDKPAAEPGFLDRLRTRLSTVRMPYRRRNQVENDTHLGDGVAQDPAAR